MTFGESIMGDKPQLDKQARLAAIMQSINEYVQKGEQALYGAELSLKTKEWTHLKRCAELLILAEEEIRALGHDARSLQEEIEKESQEVIL